METSIQEQAHAGIEVVKCAAELPWRGDSEADQLRQRLRGTVLSSSVIPQVSSAEMDHYRKPFVTPGEDRRTTLTWAVPDSTRW